MSRCSVLRYVNAKVNPVISAQGTSRLLSIELDSGQYNTVICIRLETILTKLLLDSMNSIVATAQMYHSSEDLFEFLV